jgi:hypothetical protein
MIERVRQRLPDGLEDLHNFVECRAARYCRLFGLQSGQSRVHKLYLLVLEAVHEGGLHDPGKLVRFVETVARYSCKC